jgi:hypothetical protein
VHWRLTNYQGFPAGTRIAAVRAATDSIVERLRARIEQAAQAVRDRSVAAPVVATQLDDHAGPLLRTLALANAPDAEGMHDAVARQLLECAFVHHERTSDWNKTHTLLRLALRHARGAAVLTQIRENVAGVERMLASLRRNERPYYSQPHVKVIQLEVPSFPPPEYVDQYRRAIESNSLAGQSDDVEDEVDDDVKNASMDELNRQLAELLKPYRVGSSAQEAQRLRRYRQITEEIKRRKEKR